MILGMSHCGPKMFLKGFSTKTLSSSGLSCYKPLSHGRRKHHIQRKVGNYHPDRPCCRRRARLSRPSRTSQKPHSGLSLCREQQTAPSSDRGCSHVSSPNQADPWEVTRGYIYDSAAWDEGAPERKQQNVLSERMFQLAPLLQVTRWSTSQIVSLELPEVAQKHFMTQIFIYDFFLTILQLKCFQTVSCFPRVQL